MLFCLCFDFALVLVLLFGFVLEDSWLFALTYSPTRGNSLTETIRFDDRLSLERAWHEPNKKGRSFHQTHLVIYGSTTQQKKLSLRRLRCVPVRMHSPSVVSCCLIC